MVAKRQTTQPSAPSTVSVQLGEGCFIVQAEQRNLSSSPSDTLLARWWVNGRPVIPARSEKEEPVGMQQSSEGLTREVRIAFGLPSALGALKAGDRVDLQVLYVPHGSRLVLTAAGPDSMLVQMVQMAAMTEKPSLPVLSNRMSFVITEALLPAGRGR